MLVCTDVTGDIKRKLLDKLQSESALEQYWQKKLEKATGLGHERIAHGMITDLSNRDVLVEIKNGSGFREALGQIQIYAHLKQKRDKTANLKKILVIFNPDWSDELMTDYKDICKSTGIHLVLLDQRNLVNNDFEDLLSLLRPQCRQINFRGILEGFKHRLKEQNEF